MGRAPNEHGMVNTDIDKSEEIEKLEERMDNVEIEWWPGGKIPDGAEIRGEGQGRILKRTDGDIHYEIFSENCRGKIYLDKAGRKIKDFSGFENRGSFLGLVKKMAEEQNFGIDDEALQKEQFKEIEDQFNVDLKEYVRNVARSKVLLSHEAIERFKEHDGSEKCNLRKGIKKVEEGATAKSDPFHWEYQNLPTVYEVRTGNAHRVYWFSSRVNQPESSEDMKSEFKRPFDNRYIFFTGDPHVGGDGEKGKAYEKELCNSLEGSFKNEKNGRKWVDINEIRRNKDSFGVKMPSKDTSYEFEVDLYDYVSSDRMVVEDEDGRVVIYKKVPIDLNKINSEEKREMLKNNKAVARDAYRIYTKGLVIEGLCDEHLGDLSDPSESLSGKDINESFKQVVKEYTEFQDNGYLELRTEKLCKDLFDL